MDAKIYRVYLGEGGLPAREPIDTNLLLGIEFEVLGNILMVRSGPDGLEIIGTDSGLSIFPKSTNRVTIWPSERGGIVLEMRDK